MNEHVVIKKDRTVIVPESLRKIAIQHDHNVKTITFDCPRYAGEDSSIDMSTMKIYINYMLSDKTVGASIATNIMVDEEDPTIMHFDWLITNALTYISGIIYSLICIKQVDDKGNELYHWNSELFQKFLVGEGMECVETVADLNADIITDLLTRMEYVETIATPENMQDYVNEYLNNNPTPKKNIEDFIYDYLLENANTSYESMQNYVKQYLNEHPPLFVIGSKKPGVKCLWFNTGDGSETTENTITEILADSAGNTIYAEVAE